MSKLAYPNIEYQWKRKIPLVLEQLAKKGFNAEFETYGTYFITIKINKPNDWNKLAIAEQIIKANKIEYYIDGQIPTMQGKTTMYLIFNFIGFGTN